MRTPAGKARSYDDRAVIADAPCGARQPTARQVPQPDDARRQRPTEGLLAARDVTPSDHRQAIGRDRVRHGAARLSQFAQDCPSRSAPVETRGRAVPSVEFVSAGGGAHRGDGVDDHSVRRHDVYSPRLEVGRSTQGWCGEHGEAQKDLPPSRRAVPVPFPSRQFDQRSQHESGREQGHSQGPQRWSLYSSTSSKPLASA